MWPNLGMIVTVPANRPMFVPFGYQNVNVPMPTQRHNVRIVHQQVPKPVKNDLNSRLEKCSQAVDPSRNTVMDLKVKEDVQSSFDNFQRIISEEIKNLLIKYRKTESRIVTTIGMNVLKNKDESFENQHFTKFQEDVNRCLEEIKTQQGQLQTTLSVGLNEIRSIISNSLSVSDERDGIDPIVKQLMPKFDETYRNHPTLFLRIFDTFLKSMSVSPALQRLYFISAVQLDNPIWRRYVSMADNYEVLKKPFLTLTWSKRIQIRVYMEFEKTSFKNMKHEDIGIEVKKWCSIVEDMDDVEFKHFLASLLEKLPRRWQATLRVFAINNFDSLIKNINLCLDNESSLPTYDHVINRQKENTNN